MNNELLSSIRSKGFYELPENIDMSLIEKDAIYLVENGYLREYTISLDNIIYGKCR